MFPASTTEDVPAAVQRLLTILAFRAPARRLVRDVARAGGQAWLYVFTRNPLGGRGAGAAVVHGIEIPYVFGTFRDIETMRALAQETDRALSADMIRRWTAFAREGTPNPGRPGAPEPEPKWPAYAADDQHIEFGDRIVVGEHLDQAACNLVDQAAARRRHARQ
jgi:carboxylesterase type B